MEASSVTAPTTPNFGQALRSWLSKYGLILVLLILPVYYGIQDLQDDGNLTHLATNLKDGISNGSIWALVALGYTLVYGIIELINFAHGDVFMIGSFIAVGLYATFGLTPDTGPAGLFIGLLGALIIAAASEIRIAGTSEESDGFEPRPKIWITTVAVTIPPIMKTSPWAKLMSSRMP